MTQIIEQGHVVRGWLGIEAQDLTAALAESFQLPDTNGVLISGILRNGPADDAGLLPGDVVTRINDTPVANASEAMKIISAQKPDTLIELGGMRQGQPFAVRARVIQRPAQSALNS